MSSSWRYLSSAGSKISSFKGYISGREPGASGWRSPRAAIPPGHGESQGWRAWAGEKIRVRRRGGNDPRDANAELVNVFPGWAARRYAPDHGVPHPVPRPFEVEVFVSGFVISHRTAANASRSQRAFIRLAKGFASLPKLVENAVIDVADAASGPSFDRLTPSTEELLSQVKLPPRPTEITDNYDVDALERQLKRAKKIPAEDDADSASDTSSISSQSSTYDFPTYDAKSPSPNDGVPTPIEVLRQLHANLERRLQPFWSSVLPNRTVQLRLFATPHDSNTAEQSFATGASSSNSSTEELIIDPEQRPLASQEVFTAADGSFQATFRVKWEDLCQHPQALQIAFGESADEHELLVVAQLLPIPSTPVSATPEPTHTPRSASGSYFHRHREREQSQNQWQSQDLSLHTSRAMPKTPPTPVSAPLASFTRIPITHSPLRVISDIDDTVKLSGVLSGARAVFHNVFVKDLKDNVIPGMGEWYAAMWSRGVRFHYVSNGPFEILPVLNEFFQISQLPPGSIKLRSYAGRSLFNGLLSAPAARKRAGVVDVLDAFPDSRFFLIGDTGEQDLELYADLARERPHQILGAFLRDADANTIGGPEPVEDPTGWKAIGAAGTRPNTRPLVPRSESSSGAASIDSSSPALSFLKYNKNKPTSTPSTPGDINKTPKPNRYTLDGVTNRVVGKSRLGFQTASLDDQALAKASEQGVDPAYFGLGPLSAEPERDTFGFPDFNDADTDLSAVMTPTPSSTARMEPSVTISQRMSNLRTASQSSSAQTPISTYITEPPKPTPPPSITAQPYPYPRNLDPSSKSFSFRSQQTGSSNSSASESSKKSLTEAEEKRNKLQLRVYRARTQMPSHIPLRVFRDPVECVEVQEILDREGWNEEDGAPPMS